METKTVQLKCQVCGGIMTVEEDKSILACPYCGSKEFIKESDEVKIERMKKDVELKKLDFEDRERERKFKENEENRKAYNTAGFICLGFIILFTLITLLKSHSNNEENKPVDTSTATVSMLSTSFADVNETIENLF